MVEKTLAKNGVIKRNLAVVNVNYITSHDTTTPLAIEAFDNFKEKIIGRNKVIRSYNDNGACSLSVCIKYLKSAKETQLEPISAMVTHHKTRKRPL